MPAERIPLNIELLKRVKHIPACPPIDVVQRSRGSNVVT